MRKYPFLVMIAIAISLGTLSCQKENAIDARYLDASMPVEKRVKILIGQMTLREKIGQMSQFVGINELMNISNNDGVIIPDGEKKSSLYPNLTAKDISEMVKIGEIGSFLKVTGPREANYLQSLADSSRLRIPLLIADDAIHGHGMYPAGATIFPTPIGIASSFNDSIAQYTAAVTATEMRATGYHWTFSPNIDIARDARWGRVGETFGEDPLLVTNMGLAMIKGYQGKRLSDSTSVLACAKHFVAGGEPINGLNIAPMDISELTLHEIFYPPFKAAADAGVATFMAAHNEVNGSPCHSSTWLFRDVLQQQWKYKGFVVSDWDDVERLYKGHRVARSIAEAQKLSVISGIDVHMHGPGYIDNIDSLVQCGDISIKLIDEAVKEILTYKFSLGLFENRYVDVLNANKIVLQPSHREKAYHAAQQSIVLLKNDANILPLKKNIKSIFISGPNANNQTILGDWAVKQPDENIITILEGIQNKVSTETTINYFHSGLTQDITDSTIAVAVQQAKNNDIAILVMGENALRYERKKTCGENHDRSDIDLPGLQTKFVQAIYNTGVPVILVLVNGRPLGVEWCADNLPAIVEAWEPGMFGGLAVADILFGDYNPSGKLPITIPRSAGHIKQYYYHKPSQNLRKFAFSKSTPLYEFGYGLSYTTFSYSDIKLPKEIQSGDNITVHFTIQNSGKVAGSETALIYLRDDYSTFTQPVKKLIAYKQVYLKSGEKTEISIEIDSKAMQMLNKDLNPIIEPGSFTVIVGDENLVANFEVK